jgi:HrpA-like RNA helicase
VAEILRSNLALTCLRLMQLNISRIDVFPFIEKPDDAAFAEARDSLLLLGAVESTPTGIVLTSPVGERMAKLNTVRSS